MSGPLSELEQATRILIHAARDVLDSPNDHYKRQALRAAMAVADDELPILTAMSRDEFEAMCDDWLQTDAAGNVVGRP